MEIYTLQEYEGSRDHPRSLAGPSSCPANFSFGHLLLNKESAPRVQKHRKFQNLECFGSLEPLTHEAGKWQKQARAQPRSCKSETEAKQEHQSSTFNFSGLVQ
eukprot:1159464-Pelagomonas_calceolata.AAC.14